MSIWNGDLLAVVLQVGKQGTYRVTSPAGGSATLTISPEDPRDAILLYGVELDNPVPGRNVLTIRSTRHAGGCPRVIQSGQLEIAAIVESGDPVELTVINAETSPLSWTLHYLELTTSQLRWLLTRVGGGGSLWDPSGN